MRHNVFGKKLNRDIKTRNALFRSLVQEMVEHGKVVTTYPKAKAVRGLIEKTVTRARTGTDAAHAIVEGLLLEKELVDKMMGTVAPAFKNRPGGYIRIIKMGKRMGDTAEEVTMEWTEKIEDSGKEKGRKGEKDLPAQAGTKILSDNKKEQKSKTGKAVKK
ncbi:50S ribosomal protein L17 [Candidatus Gottesmanbacteria bacterium RIFCSPHIGHO2_02_FULL_39_11]|uniref:50S ribosomal protein L17 n=1 Tax=Candidatus Gottesmanbacteria bacterium RIFCSPHIGHO2_02_FULL_39_11 TaxID=1798382 RepID=A0A1F5ZWK4_9BACT|nr:MAG: 50S ribosomal protein L17 [Candidatus Gottesmanbacteria bacterium RIFCSPHIGHO2_02_FULL_39_11]